MHVKIAIFICSRKFDTYKQRKKNFPLDSIKLRINCYFLQTYLFIIVDHVCSRNNNTILVNFSNNSKLSQHVFRQSHCLMIRIQWRIYRNSAGIQLFLNDTHWLSCNIILTGYQCDITVLAIIQPFILPESCCV